MITSRRRLLRGALLPVLAAGSLLAAVTPAPASAAPRPQSTAGTTQPVHSYEDAIREYAMVEAPIDSDGDGANDLVRVDIIRPEESGPDLKVPVIIVESPYYDNAGRGNESQRKAYDADGNPISFPLYYDNYFVPRGYAVLQVDMIGTTKSDGCPTTGGRSDVVGGKAVIDWLGGRAKGFAGDGSPVEADWASGKSAMIGKSYDGTVANGVATTGVEGLTTIVPIAAISTWYRYTRMNGLINFTNYPSFLAKFVDTDPDAKCAHVHAEIDAGADDATGNYSDYWRERDYIDGAFTDAGKVKASVFAVHGVNDLNVKPDHFSLWWKALGENRVPRKLWLSQYGHTEPFDFRRDEWVDTLHRWFDRWLYGVRNGIDREPAVDVQTGVDTWATQRRWPATALKLPLRPREGGRLGLLPDIGATESFTDLRMTEGQMVSEPTEPHPGRLAYVGSPLKRAMRLSGTPIADLRIKVDEPTTNLTALLVDYGDDDRIDALGAGGGIDTLDEQTCHGESIDEDSACYRKTVPRTVNRPVNVVARGWLDAQNRHSLSDPTPMPLGSYARVKWGTLPQDYVFKKGHRLALIVAGTDRNYVPSEPGTGAQVTMDLGRSRIVVPLRPQRGGQVTGSDFGTFGGWTGPAKVELPVPPLDFR